MGEETMLTARIPADWLERFERLAERWPEVDAAGAALAGANLTRSAMVRLALLRGLQALEAQADSKAPKRLPAGDMEALQGAFTPQAKARAKGRATPRKAAPGGKRRKR